MKSSTKDKILLRNVQFEGSLYKKFPKIYNVYFIAIISCISGLMLVFDISSMSSMLGTAPYKKYFGSPDATIQGGITASMSAGSFVGSLISPTISEAFGRRVSLHLCATFWIIGAVIQCASHNVAMLVCGRLISGIGVGFGSSAAPVYCSEIAPPKIRGLIGSLFQFSVTFGIMILFYIGYGCSFLDSSASFRITWGLQMVPGFILLVCTFFIPESPRWLGNKGNWDECINVITRINNTTKDTMTEEVALQVEEMKQAVNEDVANSDFGYIDLFKKKTIRKTIVGMSAQMWQQLCGMNVMMYYIVYIFEMAGHTGNNTLVSCSIQYVLNVVMTIPALFLVDKVGRRPLLLIGGVLMFSWLFAVSGLLATYSIPAPDGFEGDDTVRIRIPDENKSAADGVIACCYLFVCSFAPTWGVGIWLYCSEIFNNKERAKGSALSTSVNWIFNFAIALFVPSAFKNITWKTYIVFGVFSVALTIQTYFMFPETKGKSLEEIDMMWAANLPAWRTKSWVPDVIIPQLDVEPLEKGGSEGSTEFVEGSPYNDEKPITTHFEGSSDNDSI
ncbi:hypothetical protein TPHA_0O00950 [Tetrapisispora phaffii CBS 4417]|uniref:Major facilitator superfamily (MFS) profile domain-containing protein n=1 Tax=Tetrapisispora phaffii (strain ATCC 24235 / CBS 4417 / NBRC 1672 / NRRL Y-8282 / UCD 70-5) TaxID=1071381 RepID=G8C1N6_TETPH|nr:hypothetical protein TPHA_0O00950 [Tetrapisispora phaffii CBS 4417]CCE66064.1 hypothetical protein TPHA_0O00950 [Tetrapisispora phaffii CBS 4417]